MGISDEEMTRRVEAARQARRSTELEGVSTDEVTRADEDAYVRGEIDEAELIGRARDRYGLPR